jgi:hypothetical protein
MIRKTIFVVASVAAIGAAALIPTAAFAGGGGKGGGGMGNHGHGHGHGHGHWGGGFGGGVVVIAPSCWRWVPGVGKVWSATKSNTAEEAGLADIRSLMTMVGGRIVHETQNWHG